MSCSSPGRNHSVGRGRLFIGRSAAFGPISGLAIAVVLLMPRAAATQDVTTSALKAAFIYNFAKFTEWPADAMAVTQPLTMCVLGDPAVGDALERAVMGRLLESHSMLVTLLAGTSPQRVCQVLYVSGVTPGQAGQAIAPLRDAPVLTISDVEGFTKIGGIAQFFFEYGQLRFSVRTDSAKRARLQISSRLLTLAKPI